MADARPASGVEHIYPKNSHASSTAVTDGQHIYASFGTHGIAAFDFTGKVVWHRKLGDLNNQHGSAGSPVLYKDRLFIYQDHRGSANLGSFVAAFSTKTGETIWWKDRIELRSHSAFSLSSRVVRPRLTVPFMGRPVIVLPSSWKKSSGEADAMT